MAGNGVVIAPVSPKIPSKQGILQGNLEILATAMAQLVGKCLFYGTFFKIP